VRKGRGRKEQSQYATQGQPRELLKAKEGKEAAKGRGRKEQSQYATQGQPKGTFKR
jgi:hypothetical protein